MGSWDRMVVPYPFTHAIFLYGDPISIARDEAVGEARQRVEQTLNALAERAEKHWQP
ncbi:MAG TPA: hypothetical protein VER58_07820 [Thermoanaerobaculia bacterium]|nr:hypothetical protein [Thermoanaerobaculia bacterium]